MPSSLSEAKIDVVSVAPRLALEAVIESVDQEGRGIAHSNGKVIFIEGALPGERVTYSVYLKKPRFELAVQQNWCLVEPHCARMSTLWRMRAAQCNTRTHHAGRCPATRAEEDLARIGKVPPADLPRSMAHLGDIAKGAPFGALRVSAASGRLHERKTALSPISGL
jgi:predicted RNA-binding protein with TRAM domain